MLTKEELKRRLIKSGMKFEENSPTPGVRIGDKFYGYDEVPLPSEILAGIVIDFDEMAESYSGIKHNTHVFDVPNNENGIEKCQ